jgi:hypothetical protein
LVNRVYGKERYTKEHIWQAEELKGVGGQLHLHAASVKQEVVLRLLREVQEEDLPGLMLKGDLEHLL